MLKWHHSFPKHLRIFRSGAEPPGGGEYGRTLRTLSPLQTKVPTPLRRVGMLVVQQSLTKHLCFHDACTLHMTKRRRQRSEAQLAVARRGREAQAAAASSPNAAAIVLATAGAPAPGAPLAAIRRLASRRLFWCSRTGHFCCCRCSGWRGPSRATNRAETQSILLSCTLSRSTSQAPCP